MIRVVASDLMPGDVIAMPNGRLVLVIATHKMHADSFQRTWYVDSCGIGWYPFSPDEYVPKVNTRSSSAACNERT